MKTIIYLCNFLIFVLIATFCFAQEYATFAITSPNQGTGSFAEAALPNFVWVTTGTLDSDVQIKDNETFEDGSQFEAMFGQADDKQNLRTQILPNGAGTNGQPITSIATTVIVFENVAPANKWGFCITDLDVENMTFMALDEDDNLVPPEVISEWLVELFDADWDDETVNYPKWDPETPALLGSDTPEDYTEFNNLVIGGMPSCEAPAAFFMPTIPLKSLTILFYNLQELYSTSYHLFIASLNASGIDEQLAQDFSVYPNPTDGKFQITSTKFQTNPKLQAPNSKVEIVNLYGKVVKTINPPEEDFASLNLQPATCNLQLNISPLPPGVYFVRIMIDNQTVVKKIIKM